MSRFLPNLYVASVMKRLNLKNDLLTAKIPDYTENGLVRLKNLQQSSGGWGWWSSEVTDPKMTALVVYGLAYALGSDITDDQRAKIAEMISRGAVAAERMALTQSLDLESKVALIHALALFEKKHISRPIANEIESIYVQRVKLTTASLAKLLAISSVTPVKFDKKALTSLLISRATVTTSGASWRGSDYAWYHHDEEATAMAIKGVLAVDPKNSVIEKAVIWLSQQKRDGYWVSTKTTAEVIEALSLYLKKSGELNPAGTATISLNGKLIRTEKITNQSVKQAATTIRLSEQELAAGKLAIKFSGKGKLYYSVNLRYVTIEQPIRAHDNGLKITRTYTKLVYTTDRTGNGRVDRVPFTGTCKSGDEIEVTIKVNSGRTLEHVMIEDFFPSGMEVLKKQQEWYGLWCRSWFWGYTHSEARDDRMLFFMNDMDDGEMTFTYLLRAETPGRFTALPARGECMYQPAISGNSAASVVKITE